MNKVIKELGKSFHCGGGDCFALVVHFLGEVGKSFRVLRMEKQAVES